MQDNITKTATDTEEKKNEKKPLAFLKNIGVGTKIIVAIAICLAIVLVTLYIVNSNQNGKFSTLSESSLEKILQISELSTLEYDYNAVAKKYVDGDKDKDVEYYVSYNGTVTAGVDFNKIEITDIDNDAKKVVFTLPDIDIQNVNIDEKSLEYIFVKDEYETETVFQEAYKVCKSDLENRVETETLIKDSARENAISTIKALFEPLVESIDKSYIVEVK